MSAVRSNADMMEAGTRRAVAAATAAVAMFCLAPAAADAASGTFTVTSNADTAGTCPTPSTCASLRQAINSANATTNTPGVPDTIGFSIFAQTIDVTSQLPTINSQTSIFGGGHELNGAGAATAGVDGLRLASTASNSTLSSLVITRFTGAGIDINGADNVIIGGSSIGTNVNQDPGLGNGGNGITVHGGANITRIGDLASHSGNVIAGNGGDGVNVDATSSPTAIDINEIGVRNPANVVVGNAGDGVDLSGPSTSVGEPVTGAGNTISGNGGFGVRINGPSGDANSILGNEIGVDASNGSAGVLITGVGANNNKVGELGDGLGNTISGNGSDGIRIFSGATGNSVVANRIGTNPAGTRLSPNHGNGVNVNSSPSNTIGGSAPGAGNLISGNLSSGIDFENTPSSNNVVQGNRIGTNAAGTLALPNASGIQAEGSNVIGGSGGGEGNLVSGNLQQGIAVQANGTSSVLGNLVGTNAAGTGPIPNGEEGIDAAQVNATIGGPGGAANTVAFNLGSGIRVEQTGVVVAENSVFSNGGLGIDLDPAGVGGGAQVPSLTTALASGGQTVVRGTIANSANSSVTLRFSSSPDCDPSGFGEGRTPIGSASATTDGAGNASFDVTLPAATSLGQQVTATATGPSGTSEFSACRTVESPPPAAPATTATPPAAKRAPALTSVTQSASTWRAGSALAQATKAKPPLGTTFAYKLDRAATVRFEFTQRVAGRKVGRRCVAQTSSNRRKPRCTRTVPAGTLNLSGHAGTNRVRFQGRLSRAKKLKPGHYTLTITATASGLRSASRALSFTIVKG
ncbi:MAG: hypothetical protein QOH11_1343 [Solirubrobacteraceae bacterium]|nr:hypothetical protein [Solirubrobacteraceae bacterium]